MEVMPSRNQNRGRFGSFEYFGRIGGRCLESKLVPDVVRAQRGPVHDCSERNLVFQMRKQHRARKIPGADDIQPLNRRREVLISDFGFRMGLTRSRPG